MKLPPGWRKLALNEVFPEITVGFVGNVSSHYCDEATGVPFYRTGNVRDGTFSHDDIRFVTRDFHRKNRKSSISNGDILVARVGANLGMVCRVDGISGDANAANVIIIRRNEQADSDYFAEFLGSPMGQSQIHARSVGGAQGVFNTRLAEQIEVLVPPLEEQQTISELLLDWNYAIQKTEQLIAAKERHYSHELSRLFSEGGTTPRKCRLGDISYVPQKLPEAPKPDDVYVLVRLYCKGIEKNERQKKAPTKNGRPILRRNAGELLVGRQNIHNGGFGIVPQGLDGSLASNAITSLSFHPDKACTEYVFFYLSRPSFYKKLERVMGGTGQKEISESQLLAISIPLPDIRAQTAIARYLNALREEIDLLGQSVAALRTQKRGLMQKLLTGQWRLPDLKEAS